MRRRLLAAGALTAVTVAASLTSLPARAQDTTRAVAPGVTLHAFTRIEPGVGPQEVRVLRFHAGGALALRPIAAADLGAARLPVSQLVLRSGALAAVNGNFFTSSGNVRGILVTGGVLRSEPEAPINGAATARAAWRVDGDSVAFSRPSSSLHLHRGAATWGLNGIDRVTGYLGNPDEAVLQTSRFGATSTTPTDGFDLVIDGVDPVRADADGTGTVAALRSAGGPIPAGGAVVSAVGANAEDLRRAGFSPGEQVTVHAHVDDAAFASAAWAGGGGPWLVHDGGPIPREAMLGEGFAPTHLDQWAPRTAIGRTAAGEVLLVTVDGRQRASVGATLASLARIMIEQGAVDAIALDGGGSTAMSVDGLLANVPSGEDSTGRVGAEAAVADGVGVFFDFHPAAVARVAGADRVGTAVEVSKRLASARTVVLATSAGFADALAGAPLAAAAGAPVLLNPPAGLDPRVAEEIERLGATKAYVLGGTAALPAEVESNLARLGVSAERLAGADRWETAAAIVRAIGPSPGPVVVASGESFPDALAAGALGLPVLLTARDTLPDATRAALAGRPALVVGGPAAVADGVVPGAARVFGADRYATSAAVADWGIAHGRYTDEALVATRGDAYPDALVGGTFRRPLLLVGRFGLGEAPATRDWIAAHAGPARSAVLLGGRVAVSTMTHVELEAAVAQ